MQSSVQIYTNEFACGSAVPFRAACGDNEVLHTVILLVAEPKFH